MSLANDLANLVSNVDTFRDAAKTRNPRVLKALLGPAYRGFVKQAARQGPSTTLPAKCDVEFRWNYERDDSDFGKLYNAAKLGQWNGATALDWSIEVDPESTERPLVVDEWVPFRHFPVWNTLTARQQKTQVRDFMSWILSQFLHGEQGALFAATQVTQAVPWYEGKLYGATQVVDEARHLEVFHRYLSTKLEKTYDIDDNLYVIIDALMTDGRFDIKFLGMQIMIEGLALGAFGTFRQVSREPLLRDLLKYVITDEARHVHYGVIALKRFNESLSPSERREREDWAFELALLMRNRFLLHEFYDEHYGHAISRKQWDELVLASPMMEHFRQTMFERIVPNLRRIGLMSDRMRPYYEEAGLIGFAGGKSADELTVSDLLGEA